MVESAYSSVTGSATASAVHGRRLIWCRYAIVVTLSALVAGIVLTTSRRAQPQTTFGLSGFLRAATVGPTDLASVRAEQLRQLLDTDLHWESEKEAAVQCTVDVTTSVAYLALGVIFAEKAIADCPDPSSQIGCGVSISALVTSVSWIGAYVSIMAESCSLAAGTKLSDRRWSCAADIGTLVGVMSAQAVVLDCNATNTLQPDSAAEQLPDMAAVGRDGHMAAGLDFETAFSWRLGRLGEAERIGRRLENASEPILAPSNAPPQSDNASEPILTWSSVTPQNDREGPAANEQTAADITLCALDVVQHITYVIAAAFQIHSAAVDCPDPRMCAVDILNAISSIAWVVQFSAVSVADCAVEDFLPALCTGDIADMVAGTVNIAATALTLRKDCGKQ